MFRIHFLLPFAIGFLSLLCGLALIFGHGTALSLWTYPQVVHFAGVGMGIFGLAIWTLIPYFWRKSQVMSAGGCFFIGLGLMMAANYFYLTASEDDASQQTMILVIFGLMQVGAGICLALMSGSTEETALTNP